MSLRVLQRALDLRHIVSASSNRRSLSFIGGHSSKLRSGAFSGFKRSQARPLYLTAVAASQMPAKAKPTKSESKGIEVLRPAHPDLFPSAYSSDLTQ